MDFRDFLKVTITEISLCTGCSINKSSLQEENQIFINKDSNNNLFEAETIDEVFCEKCSKKTKCIKLIKSISLSEFVIITLKSSKSVEDMINFYENPENKQSSQTNIYRLKAVIEHHFLSNKQGHYIIFLRKDDGKVYECNDSIIKTNKKIVCGRRKCSRILFFVRHKLTPYKNPKGQDIVNIAAATFRTNTTFKGSSNLKTKSVNHHQNLLLIFHNIDTNGWFKVFYTFPAFYYPNIISKEMINSF